MLIGILRHYAWEFFPYSQLGMASKGLGGLATLWLLWLVRVRFKSKAMLAFLLWWAWEEFQVSVCSAWYIYSPWPVPQGVPICSAKTGVDLGAVSLVILSLIICAYITLMGEEK